MCFHASVGRSQSIPVSASPFIAQAVAQLRGLASIKGLPPGRGAELRAVAQTLEELLPAVRRTEEELAPQATEPRLDPAGKGESR